MPAHRPPVVTSVCPTAGVPLTTGGEVTDGATAADGVSSADGGVVVDGVLGVGVDVSQMNSSP